MPVPICVPARAAFAASHYGHRSEHWDNATPYTSEPLSWGHRLRAAVVEVGSIGTLHYRNSEDSVGLDFQQMPMHVVNGFSDVLGCIREPLPKRLKSHTMAEKIGAGETRYIAYDRNIANAAVQWLEHKAEEASDQPWVLFVSLVAPHFPLIAPQEYFDLFSDLSLMLGKAEPELNDEHPWRKAMRNCILYDNFTPEWTRRALAA